MKFPTRGYGYVGGNTEGQLAMSQGVSNPCLLAIILTISTHSGPQFVFHYPPQPDTHDYRAAAPLKQKESELVSDSSNYEGHSSSDYSNQEREDLDVDDSGSSDENMTKRKPEPPRGRLAESLLARMDAGKVKKRIKRTESKHSMNSSDVLESSKNSSGNSSRRSSVGPSVTNNSSAESWQKVLGFECDFLSELLCPPRGMCNTKFEMTVDDMVFLGMPVHIRPDGLWKHVKNKTTTHAKSSVPSTLRKSRKTNSVATSGTRTELNKQIEGEGESSGAEGDDENEENEEKADISSSDEEQEDLGASKQEYTDPQSPMRMFHVSFVMNPPITEYNMRINEMFHCVLSNFVRCLRSEQAKNNYVWREVSILLAIRDRAALEGYTAAQLWNECKSKSNLALAIGQLFDAISESSIANVVLNGKLRSFQIPIVSVYYRLPAITQRISHMRISHLTSTTPYVDVADEATQGVTEHFGILLLDEPENIVKDIRADPFSPLAAFIRTISPQHSIQTLASECGWNVDEVIDLTNSLIYWRRARAITPLHHRSTYIVSPLANMKLLYEYIPLFREKFPSLPPLPKILSMLSTGKPRPLSGIIPSRDHREVYLSAVGWLMRFGLVTQLRSFLWLKVTRRIKLAVSREIQIEEEQKELDTVESNNKPKAKTDTSTDNSSKEAAATTTTNNQGILSTDNSPTKQPPRVGFRMNDDPPEPDELPERYFGDDLMEDTIIQEPERANSIERKWLAKMVEDKPLDIVNLFHRTLKYFNGKYTVERIMLLQGLSRNDLRKLTSALEDYVIVTRHW